MKLHASIVCSLALLCASSNIQQKSSNMMKTFLNAITGNVDRKIEELQKLGANVDTQENVMMEMGLELLLKEPVIKKVRMCYYILEHLSKIFEFSSAYKHLLSKYSNI